MLINIENLSFGYDDKIILENIALSVEEKDRIGLIGENGAGKSTLLRLISGSLRPDGGNISKKSGLNIGYLEQNSDLSSDRTVFDEMLTLFDDVKAAIKEMNEIEHSFKSADETEYRRLSARYQSLSNLIAARDGFNAEVRIKTVLNGMGFMKFYDRITSTLSGGERTRLYLARLLLLSPGLLILDEPTNHLDFATLGFLEDFLLSYRGAVIIVSHDRYFLDKTVGRIWELEECNIECFKGNYSKYKVLKAEAVLSGTRAYEKQQEKIAAMKDYAARNIARATTSKSAKSRLHQLANMEVLEKPKTKYKAPKFKFEYANESMKNVLTVKNYELKIGERVLAKDITFEVFKGEKIGIIGKNGTGKSTFIKRIKSGELALGGGVRLSYFDQDISDLNPENRVLDEIWGKYHRFSQTEIRNILGRMLITDEDIDKQVKMLSGGERAKLKLAVAQAEKGNTLLLDEPTNHLDLITREALEESLKEFNGTIIFVSHDRYLLNALADKILAFEGGEAALFTGNYDEFLKQNKVKQPQEFIKPEVKNTNYRSAKQRSEEVRLKNAISDCERRIEELERKERHLNLEIADPEISSDYKRLNEKCLELERVKAELDNAVLHWEKLNLEIN